MKLNWNQKAVDIAMGRYARPNESCPEEIIERMVGAWREGFKKHQPHIDADAMVNALKKDLYNQHAAPNSPQWFNTGVDASPQVHACFINNVEDDLDSIADLWRTETRIFKRGSGSGVNVSKIREEGAPLSGGGTSSGVMSFLSVGDSNAGAIKSGGTTRRAALMRILDVDHPDILSFINWKAKEEEKVRWLVEGSNGALNYDWRGEAYKTVDGQNSNNSVRVTDDFMHAAINNKPWTLKSRVPNGQNKQVNARDILWAMAEAAHKSGDPGIMYADTINKHNTVRNDGEIVASNPCSEYLFLNDTACNLASINVAAVFRDASEDSFWRELYEIAYRWTFLLDLSIDIAGYPNEQIREKTLRYRTLGLGITGLHEYLIARGLSYASEQGRKEAARIMETVRDAAIYASTVLACDNGPCPAWSDNKRYFKAEYKTELPMRNAQLTVVAPTGTISLIMGTETSGCEPLFARSYTKTLVEGGEISMGVEDETIEIASEIDPMDHLKMVAALQEHVCGGISKTINMPNDATVEDIFNIYVEAWKMGIKAMSVYRDGSKSSAPLSTGNTRQELRVGGRRPLPNRRTGYTKKLHVAGQNMYLRTGEYPDGTLGEVFVDLSKEGSTIGGLMSAFARSLSIGLQYGVPLEEFVSSFSQTKFEPRGMVYDHETIKGCTSLLDLVVQDLALEYLDKDPEPTLTGEVCLECDSPNLKRSGTCMTCDDCGATTGCA